ncbi:NAD-dependent epimerase [Bowmanella yangjiangensis]|uniref:NAD-dependent epimerase n=1 Tax=Bowmanella yangjiangensis TaxID=2811230 RepID=A0ABS3CUX0_9ALTE|nr:NAD-dependent epimerase [Bowmanella yangjiangensis]MBN7820226.1 NAD-dependent epimerase [Bowmanella yangjiangensis]
MKFLVTGAAGFIGMFTAKALLEQGHEVVGIDNLNDYYDPALKDARLKQLANYPTFRFIKLDLADRAGIAELFAKEQFQRVIHLAAQAGVRYSLENPMAYADSNLTGTLNILEGCRHHQVEHLVYASSSSVYGNQQKVPFSENDRVDTPISLYAATKKANELMAHTYSHLYQLPTTGLRFFTVYGPWGRPDMAPFKFTKAILEGKTIDVYNHGKLQRDFTYVDDIVEGIVRVQAQIPGSAGYPVQLAENPYYALYNIGNNQPVELETFISAIEKACGKSANKNYLPMQPGDVYQTYADVTALNQCTGFAPKTDLVDGMQRFVDWYRAFYK